MDWFIALLAAFNWASMYTIFRDRNVKRLIPPWTLFAYALITSEFAWVWLPLQVILAIIFISLGALSSVFGTLAMIALCVSWGGLVKSIRLSFQSTELVEAAIDEELGNDYQKQIPIDIQSQLETGTEFNEWAYPLRMRKPGVERLKNISYGKLGILNKLDIYRPIDRPEKGCPVLLQIHGGAWMIGSKNYEALPLMNFMASKGWICVTINYRLSPSVEFPAHLEDCKRALHWIKTEGQKYGMNPDFVAVTGGSAGGHLSALMGLTENLPELQKDFPDTDTSVQAVVPFYGIYDFLARYDHPSRELLIRFIRNRIIFGSPEDKPELWELASPISHIHENSPPFMVIQGDIDSLVAINGARLFHQKLKEVSTNPAIYLELPGAEHGFDVFHSPRTEPTIKGIHKFLEWARAEHNKKKLGTTSSKEDSTETELADA
jgi:acetyl esterase/lipase